MAVFSCGVLPELTLAAGSRRLTVTAVVQLHSLSSLTAVSLLYVTQLLHLIFCAQILFFSSMNAVSNYQAKPKSEFENLRQYKC